MEARPRRPGSYYHPMYVSLPTHMHREGCHWSDLRPSLVILTPRPPPYVPLFLVCLQLHAPWLAPASSSATRESRLEWISRSSRRKDSRDSIHSADFDFGEEEDAAAANGLHPPSSGGR